LDGLVSFAVAIDRMRQQSDIVTVPQAIREHTRNAFAALDNAGSDLRMIAAGSTDLLYRQVMSLTQMDQYTLGYTATVVNAFYRLLAERGVRTFYVLDNSLRQDRFLAVLRLFKEAGITTFSPNTHGLEWQPIQRQIASSLGGANAHVAYIEPDASANHLESAVALAKQSAAVSTFRNEAPENPSFSILSLGSASSGAA
jgi:hypothetical protein